MSAMDLVPYEGTIRDVATPFDDPTARVIIISSDNMRFRVHEKIVSLASPVLADLIHRGRLSSKLRLDKGVDSVIQLSYDGRTVELFLRWCYPVALPFRSIEDLHCLRRLLEAAREYETDVSDGVAECALREAFGSDPLGAYCVAFAFGLQDCVAAAARNLLQTRFSELDSPHLDLLSAAQYRDVMRYHDECGLVAHHTAVEWCHEVPYLIAYLEPIPSEGLPQPPLEWGHVKCLVAGPAPQLRWTNGDIDDYCVAPMFVWKYLNAVGDELQVRPAPRTVLEHSTMMQVKGTQCPGCAEHFSAGMSALRRRLAEEVEKKVEKVKLPNTA